MQDVPDAGQEPIATADAWKQLVTVGAVGIEEEVIVVGGFAVPDAAQTSTNALVLLVPAAEHAPLVSVSQPAVHDVPEAVYFILN